MLSQWFFKTLSYIFYKRRSYRGSGSSPRLMMLLDGYWELGCLPWDSSSRGWTWSDAGSSCEGHHSRGTASSLLTGDSLDKDASFSCLVASRCHEHICKTKWHFVKEQGYHLNRNNKVRGPWKAMLLWRPTIKKS